MATTPSPSEWQTLYIAAMTEADKTKILAKLNEAEAAIFNRLQGAHSKLRNEAETVTSKVAAR